MKRGKLLKLTCNARKKGKSNLFLLGFGRRLKTINGHLRTTDALFSAYGFHFLIPGFSFFVIENQLPSYDKRMSNLFIKEMCPYSPFV